MGRGSGAGGGGGGRRRAGGGGGAEPPKAAEAPAAQQPAKTGSFQERIEDAIPSLLNHPDSVFAGHGTAESIPLSELRKKFPEMSREQFDGAVVQLVRSSKDADRRFLLDVGESRRGPASPEVLKGAISGLGDGRDYVRLKRTPL